MLKHVKKGGNKILSSHQGILPRIRGSTDLGHTPAKIGLVSNIFLYESPNMIALAEFAFSLSYIFFTCSFLLMCLNVPPKILIFPQCSSFQFFSQMFIQSLRLLIFKSHFMVLHGLVAHVFPCHSDTLVAPWLHDLLVPLRNCGTPFIYKNMLYDREWMFLISAHHSASWER